MANETMLQLPVVTSLDGSEYAWVSQGGTDKRATVSQMATASVFPTSAQFVLLAAAPSLVASRVLAVETNVLTATDAGAGSSITLAVATNGIGNTKLRQGAALSVIGVTGNALANVADIAGTANQTLRVNSAGTALGFGTLAPAGGGTGQTTLTSKSIILGEGTSAVSFVNTLVPGSVLQGDLGGPSFNTQVTLGNIGSGTGWLRLAGATSGAITIQPQDAAGTYNFNLPTSAGTTGQVLTSGGGGSSPMTFGAVTVPGGGTGIASGTSGGIPYFSGATTIASSAALTAGAIVLGGGAGTTPATLGSLGTTTTVLHGNAAGAPTFGAVSLTADVIGTLPVPSGGSGVATATAFAVLTGGTTATGAFQSIASVGTAGQILTSAGAGALPAMSGITTALDTLSSTRGTIIYRGASGWAALAVGTSGQALKTQGAGADPIWSTVAGTGTVTTVSPGNGLTTTLTGPASGSDITVTGTLSAAHLVNLQTGTTYAVQDTDRAKLVSYSNAAPIAVSIAQAGAASAFQSGWFHFAQNRGAGAVTYTPTTSTIDGAATLVLSQNTGAAIFSDGTNYYTSRSVGSVTSVATAGLATGGPVTTTGTVTVTAATQADMETATSTTTAVVPGRVQYHPSSAKVWAECDAAGAAQISYNVASITDAGTGLATANMTTAFSSTAYASIVVVDGGATALFGAVLNTASASALTMQSWNLSSARADPTHYMMCGFGDFA